MRGLRIDRTRAVRVAAVAGMVLLAASSLPGLLRPPEPPELPADVGFTPAEKAAPSAPSPAVARPRSAAPTNQHRRPAVESRKGRPTQPRRDEAEASGPARRQPPAPPGSLAGGRKPGLDRPPTAAPEPAYTPRPVYEPPPVYLPPPPEPPPTPIPTDGSQEFAPR